MEPTPEQIIQQYMRELGRRGGAARAANLTPEQRSRAASKAGKAKARKQRAASRSKESENRA